MAGQYICLAYIVFVNVTAATPKSLIFSWLHLALLFSAVMTYLLDEQTSDHFGDHLQVG
jgi:hypothetical protein